MSTRASYKFESNTNYLPDVIVYKHHDGYPTGAALWLHNATDFDSRGRSITPESFIRENERLEITAAPHGDEEYRYHILSGGEKLIAMHREIGEDEWDVFFDGELSDFFEEYPDFIERAKEEENESVEDSSDALSPITKNDMGSLSEYDVVTHRETGDAWVVKMATGNLVAFVNPETGEDVAFLTHDGYEVSGGVKRISDTFAR